jgi:gliding motility-associated-like protein
VKRILFACFLIGLSGTLSAQVTSRQGRFQVDKNQGCAPFTVTIVNTNVVTTGECTSAKPCIMTFEGTTQQQNTFTHTYATAGTYTLQVLYQSIGADDIVITVDPNIQPDYEVYRCSSNDVTIKVTDNHFEQYIIKFGDGSADVAIPFSNNATATHNYAATPPLFNIEVRGKDSSPNAADNCTPKIQTVTTLASLPAPRISALTSLSSTSLRLDLPATTPTFIQYRLEIAVNNSTTFQVLRSVYNTTSIDVTNLLLDNNYYCFRLSSFDPCTNGNTYSNTICSQDFDVSFTNGTNVLTWKAAPAAGTVAILRKDMTDVSKQTTFSNIPLSPMTYSDADYDCNHEYCYTLTVSYTGGATSKSLEKCGTGILVTTHPAVDDVNATVVNGATLSWTVNSLIDVNEFQIQRSENGSAFNAFATTTTLTFADATYTTEGAYCYKIGYNDKCENFSADGVVVCPVRLFGTIDDGNVVTLNWTKYLGWKGGVKSYQVEKLNKNSAVVGTFVVGLDTFLVDSQPDLANQVVSYRVRATPNIGTATSFSNIVTFTKSVNLSLPTAFTPNGDGLNDVFTISGQFVDKMNIRIFDRWGILVFASERNEPWNGTREGIVLPESSYVWKAEITDLAGQTFSREGTLILLR